MKVWSLGPSQKPKFIQSFRSKGQLESGAMNKDFLVTGNSLGVHQVFSLRGDAELLWQWYSEGESLLSLSLQKRELLSCSSNIVQLWNFDESGVRLKKKISSGLSNRQIEWLSSNEFLLLGSKSSSKNVFVRVDLEKDSSCVEIHQS